MVIWRTLLEPFLARGRMPKGDAIPRILSAYLVWRVCVRQCVSALTITILDESLSNLVDISRISRMSSMIIVLKMADSRPFWMQNRKCLYFRHLSMYVFKNLHTYVGQGLSNMLKGFRIFSQNGRLVAITLEESRFLKEVPNSLKDSWRLTPTFSINLVYFYFLKLWSVSCLNYLKILTDNMFLRITNIGRHRWSRWLLWCGFRHLCLFRKLGNETTDYCYRTVGQMTQDSPK